MRQLETFLALAFMHLMMCAVFTMTLAIPTGWETAIIGGPIGYVLLLKAARDMRSIDAGGDDPTSQGGSNG